MPTNEYDEILSGGQAASGNEYDALVNEGAEQTKQGMQSAMFVAAPKDPERQAKVLELSKRTNLPTSIVDRNFDTIRSKTELTDTDYDQIIKEAPKTASWLAASADNMAVAKDDVHGLKAIEGTIEEQSLLNGLYNALSSGAATSLSNISKIPSLIYDTAAIPQNIIAQQFGVEGLQVSSKDVLPENPIAKYYDSMASNLAPPELNESITKHIGEGDYAKAGRVLAMQFAANAPQQAVNIVGIMSGAATPALVATGLSTAAQSNVENLNAGIDPVTSVSDALAKGTIESAFESLGTFGLLKHWEGVIAKNYGKDVSREVIKDFAKTLAYSFAGEANEEFLTSVAQDFTDYISGVNPEALEGIGQRALDAGFIGGVSGVGMTGPSAIGMGAARGAQIRNSTLMKDFYNKLGGNIEESKLYKRSPETQKEYIKDLVKDGPVENVYIPHESFERYFQDSKIPPSKAAQDIGILKEYNEAKETGSDVKIPLDVYANKIAGTEHWKGLQNDVKFSPEAMTVNQATEEHDKTKTDIKAEDASAEVNAEQVANQGVKQTHEQAVKFVQDDVTKQLRDAGYTAKEASAQALLYGTAFSTFAEKSGQQVQELYNRYGLKVSNVESEADIQQQMEGEQQVTYDQSYRFKVVTQESQREGVKFPVRIEGDKLTIEPMSGLKATAQIIEDENLGKTAVIDSFSHNEKYRGVSTDMIRSMEGAAARRGADTIMTSTNRLGIERSGDLVSLYQAEGYVASLAANGDTILAKKINSDKQKVFNQDSFVATNERLEANRKKLKSEGFSFDVSEDPYFDDNGNEIEGPKIGEAGSSFSVYAEDKSGNQIAQARFIINEDGILVADDNNGGTSAVDVDASFRRKGIATELYRLAAETAGIPIGDVNSKTEFGKKFRDSIRDNKIFLQEGDESTPRGQIRFGADRTFNIDLFKNKDHSTFLHETGHFLFEVMGDLAQDPNTSQSLKDDYATLLNWLGVESREQVGVEQHEKFARGFEAYLMEGKAANSKLRKAFATFKVWLTSIYSSARALNVDMTDEIKSVFDRVFAADSQVRMTENAMQYDPLFSDPVGDGMPAGKAAKYIEAREEARIFAENKVRERLMDDLKRQDQAFYKEKRVQIKDEVTKELADSRAYQALYAIQKGTQPDGSPLPTGTPEIKISRQSIVDSMGKEALKLMPSGTVSKDGLHIEMAAPLFGYADGSKLFDALTSIPKLKAAIELQTNQRMAEFFPDSLTDGTISNEAIKAVHNDKRAQMLRMELEHLASNNMPVLKETIRKVARRVPSEKIVREQAAEILGNKATSEIRPIIYQRAEIKQAKLAGEFLAKGDIDAAFEAKRKELLNHELYRAAVEAQERVEEDVKTFRKLFRSDEDLSKTRDVDLVNAARAVLAQFGITRADKSAVEYLKPIQTYEPDTYEAVLALVESASEGSGNYKDVTYNDFIAMSDAVNAMWDLSKSRRENQIDGKKVNREVIKEELNQQIDKVVVDKKTKEYNQTVDKWGVAKDMLMGAKATLTRIEHWVEAIDVGFGGPFRKYVFNPVSQSTAEYRVKKNEVMKEYLGLLKGYQDNLTKEKIKAPEFNFMFQNKAELIMAVLHSGNDSNLQKLLLGRAWGTLNEDKTLNRTQWDTFINRMQSEGVLKKSDFDFVQSIWDLNESLKPGAQKAHKQMYGYYFSEITANEFTIHFDRGVGNLAGTPVTYRGGYIPAKVDVNQNEDAKIRQEKNDFDASQKSFQFPTTGRGFTKSRVSNYNAELSLDMNLLASHIDGVLRFSIIEPRVREVARVMTDKGFRQQLAQIDTAIAKDAIIPWLQRAASQKVVNPSDTGLGKALDAAASFLRGNIATQIMFGNITNTLQQYTGLVVAMSKIKPKYIRNGLATYMTSPQKSVENILEKSTYMKSTQGSNIHEIYNAVDNIIVKPGTFDTIKDFSKRHTYFLQSFAQNQVNTIVWLGAYEQAVQNKMSEEESVKAADSAVRLTQGTNNPEDISAFETGTKTQLLFKQFAGYFNMLANLNSSEITKISRQVGLKKGAGKAFYLYMTALMIPAVLSEGIMMAMSGKGVDQDDDDEYLDDILKAFFGSQLKTITGTVPYVGPMANAVYNRFNNNPMDDRLSLSPVISSLESAAGVPHDIYNVLMNDASVKKKNVKDALSFIGLFTGLPTGPLGKPIGYAMDVSSGAAQPTGPIDYARGLATGRNGK